MRFPLYLAMCPSRYVGEIRVNAAAADAAARWQQRTRKERATAISTEIVDKTFGPFVRDYTFKDLEICALGCGAGWDGKVDLDYVNEGDAKNPELKVLPIFAVPLTVNEEMTTTLDYGFDYSGSLHYGIDVHFHAPFKMSDHIETYVTQEAIWASANLASCGDSGRSDAAHPPCPARRVALPPRERFW